MTRTRALWDDERIISGWEADSLLRCADRLEAKAKALREWCSKINKLGLGLPGPAIAAEVELEGTASELRNMHAAIEGREKAWEASRAS